jgi:hypothetical protein
MRVDFDLASRYSGRAHMTNSYRFSPLLGSVSDRLSSQAVPSRIDKLNETQRTIFRPGRLTDSLQLNLELREIFGILAVVSYTADFS